MRVVSLSLACAAIERCDESPPAPAQAETPIEYAVELPSELANCTIQRFDGTRFRIDESCYSEADDQFGNASYPTLMWSLIAGSDVNLRLSPSLESAAIARLQKTEKVQILYIRPERSTAGALSGHWAFVHYEPEYLSGQPWPTYHVGWVFDHYIARPSNFDPISSFRDSAITFNVSVDAIGRYYFHEDGTYDSCVAGKDFATTSRGRLRSFRDLILAEDYAFIVTAESLVPQIGHGPPVLPAAVGPCLPF